jgi:hypothetical protein
MADAQITPEVATGLAVNLLEQQMPHRKKLPPLVDKAVKAYQSNQAEKSLQMMAGDVCPYTKEDVEGVILENLSSQDRDPKTGQKKEPKASTPEKARYDKTQEVTEAMRDYLESGGEKIQDVLINELVVYVKHMPQYRDILYDKDGNLASEEDKVAKEIAQKLLRQPQYRRAIHRLFTEKLDPKKRLEHESIVTALEREMKQLEAQIIDPQKIDTEIAQKKLELGQKNAAIIHDPNYGNYLNLLGQLETAQEKLKTFQETYKQVRINNLEQLQQITRDINNEKQEIHNLKRSLNDQQFSNIYQFQQEASSLQALIQSLEQQKQQANTPEQKQLRAQFQEKLLQLQDAQAQLTAERIRYASDIIAIPAEAAKEFFNEALGEAANHYKEIAAKETEKKGKEEAKKVETLAEKLARKKKGERYLPDKQRARKILTLLMQPDGVTIFMKEIVQNYANYGLTDSDVAVIKDRVVEGDIDFIQNTGVSLAKAVLADYLLAGGRLSRDDIIALGNADWVKTLIDDGIAIATNKRAQIEGHIGKDVLDKLSEIRAGHKSVDWLMSNWWKLGLGILGILLLLGLGYTGYSLFTHK